MHARGARLALGLLLVVAIALWAPRPAAAASEGTGLYVGPTALPWVENQVTIDVALGLARGEVHQRFWNNTGRAVEAVYVFPLPTGAVVTGMSMAVGGARIDGVIAPRASAQAGYERAIAAGRAAALTERERPGVYTQSIAGIPADGTVVVTLRWAARLTRHQGEWELAHPLVVGPRYTPGQATGAPTIGAGQSPDTDRAPDASRVTPPRDRAATIRFQVTATLRDAGAVSSPTHTLTLGHGDDAVIATIDDPRGDRELVLRWRRAGLGMVRAFAEPTAAGTYVAVLIEPPPAAAPPRHTPRSWLIAIDRSASMQGAGAAQARRLAHAIVASLGPGDRAAVVAIGAAPRWSGADAAARAALDERIDRLPATGGDLTAGLAATLATLPASPPPAVVLITDGLVADDAAAIARATAARVTIHPVGVGAAPNRWLLEAIAAGTGGSAHVAIDPDDAEVIAAELIAAADAQPVVIDWRRPSVIEAEPARAVVVPGGSALIVAIDRSGRDAGPTVAPPTEVEVVIGGERVRAPIELVHGTELATEWARQRLTRLTASGQGAAATKLALERGLVTSTTALIAVAPTAGATVRSTVTVPLPLPAGLRPESVAASTGDVFDLVPGGTKVKDPQGGGSGGAAATDGRTRDTASTTGADLPVAPRPVPAKPDKPVKAAGKKPAEPPADPDDGKSTATGDSPRRPADSENERDRANRREHDRDGDGVRDADEEDVTIVDGTTTTPGPRTTRTFAERDQLESEDANTADEEGGEDDDRGDGGGGEGPTRTATSLPPPPPAGPGEAGDADYADDPMGGAVRAASLDSAESISVTHSGRRGLALSVNLGARLDEPAPAGQLSLAFDARIARTRFLGGFRLDITAAPTADHPVSVALLATLARSLGTLFDLSLGLDVGGGAAFDGRPGLGYTTGLTIGRGPLAFALRLSGVITTDTAPAAVTSGITVGF